MTLWLDCECWNVEEDEDEDDAGTIVVLIVRRPVNDRDCLSSGGADDDDGCCCNSCCCWCCCCCCRRFLRLFVVFVLPPNVLDDDNNGILLVVVFVVVPLSLGGVVLLVVRLFMNAGNTILSRVPVCYTHTNEDVKPKQEEFYNGLDLVSGEERGIHRRVRRETTDSLSSQIPSWREKNSLPRQSSLSLSDNFHNLALKIIILATKS